MKVIEVDNSWIFFAQGNANILLKNDQLYPGKLLRLRKKGPTSIETHSFHENHIKPKFGEHAVEMELVELSSGFIEYVHEIYEERNSVISGDTTSSTSGNVISDTTHGVLIDYVGFTKNHLNLNADDGLIHETETIKSIDSIGGAGAGSLLHMTKIRSPDQQILFTGYILEFKPKWLSQSPSAPKNAIRCRNCALSLQRTGKLPAFCRLDLVSNSHQKVYKAVQCIYDSFQLNENDADEMNLSPTTLADITTEFLERNDVLHRIQSIQALDTRGILAYSEQEEIDNDFLMAMTFRDCTLLIQIALYNEELSKEKEEELHNQDFMSVVRQDKKFYIRAKLVDLDSKKASRKNHWADTEKALLNYYI